MIARYDAITSWMTHLLALMLHADLYLHDEIKFAFHPTLTRL
jgi:hypothetical protein